MSEKIRFATVGTGWIAEAFINAAKSTGLFELSAVYSRNKENAENFAEKHGAKLFFNSLSELGACKDIDAVYIASPNSLHYAQSKLFLNAGKHVICEKPITVTPDQLSELSQLAEKNKLVYMEAIIPLHLPETAIIKQQINTIGKISGASLNFLQYSSKYPAYLSGELPNIFNPQFCTGALMDLGIYCVYMAHILFGKPNQIISCASFMESGADHSGTAIFSYNDFNVTLNYSKISDTVQISEIRGENGIINFDSVSRTQNIEVIKQKTKDKIFSHTVSLEHFESMIPEAICFYDRIWFSIAFFIERLILPSSPIFSTFTFTV